MRAVGGDSRLGGSVAVGGAAEGMRVVGEESASTVIEGGSDA